MSAPVVAVLFLTDIALGIIARTVPQLNIFVVGFPVKIAVSLIALAVAMGTIYIAVEHLFEWMFVAMRNCMALLGDPFEAPLTRFAVFRRGENRKGNAEKAA